MKKCVLATLCLFGMVSILIVGPVAADNADVIENPNRMEIVTYNMFKERTVGDCGIWIKPDGEVIPRYCTWKQRIQNFVDDIVSKYKPAIIAAQEVYLWSDCFSSVCSNCTAMGWGSYMTYFIEKLRSTGINYHVATLVRANKANVCFSLEMIGEAIIYDPDQVKFIPINENLKTDWGCSEKTTNIEEYYEHTVGYNDCLTTVNNKDYALISRAVFEFPIGTNRYFNIFNAHCGICDFNSRAVEYIKDKQNTLKEDLRPYVDPDTVIKVYPPIFAGDMNAGELVSNIAACGWPGGVKRRIKNHFIDAPHDAYDPPDSVLKKYKNCSDYFASAEFKDQSNRMYGVIDEVWVGIPERYIWDVDVGFRVVRPYPGTVKPPFNTLWHGHRTLGGDNVYSDHSPNMVELEADMTEPPIDFSTYKDCRDAYVIEDPDLPPDIEPTNCPGCPPF